MIPGNGTSAVIKSKLFPHCATPLESWVKKACFSIDMRSLRDRTRNCEGKITVTLLWLSPGHATPPGSEDRDWPVDT